MDLPQLYAKYNELQKTDNMFVLDNFLDVSQWQMEEETAFDIGCGDGKFLIEHLVPKLPNFGKFVACDCSEKMIEFARKKYYMPRVDFVKFDVSSDEIPEEFENSFNHIYSFYALHWVRKQRKAFKNIFNMLKPGGDILLCFIAKSTIYDIYESLSKYQQWQQYSVKEYISPYHHLQDPESHLEKLLKKIGFEIKVCKLVRRSFLFPNMEVFTNTITAVNPIIPKLPPDEVKTYLQDFMAEVKSHKKVIFENLNNNNDNDTVREFHKIFVVVAKKPLDV
ncbi:juvenile hormone acid O-methyltransferase-like [Diabrotica virgifera virgifera]|uniref:Methyltransferase domain-containing protein n=1 Tax=Diabrotica virgifera virgifera TaxID=50390 RepID=A0ABM5IKP2_DIAVI|nr:juvenile hormone acid O-methyltransferase-like [Diabrotica virgifera virgifera]